MRRPPRSTLDRSSAASDVYKRQTYEAADRRLQSLRPCTRREAYHADITYGTNNEYGFDYLRDNLIVSELGQCVQRELNFAIVDEVDSILIDEARTPLIISGPTDQTTDLYYRCLLYTSPSPRDRTRSRMPSSA